MADVTHQLEQLQSSLRALEADRKASSERSQKTISQQRSAIDRLRVDVERLREARFTEQKCTPSLSSQQRDAKLAEKLESYSRKVEVERRQVEELSKDFDLGQAKVAEMKRLLSGSNGTAGLHKDANKTVKVVENRLAQTTAKFNELVTKNQELRSHIDSLTKQKSITESRLHRAEKAVASRKQEIGALVEATKVALKAKSQARSEIATLRTLNDREAAMVNEELAELGKLADADSALTSAQAKYVARIAAGLSGAPAEEEAGSSACVAQQLVASLQSRTGILDLRELVQHLEEQEARNFGLFELCNKADAKLGSMKRELQALQAEAAQLESEAGLCHKKDSIRAVQASTDLMRARASGYEDRCHAVLGRLAAAEPTVQALLHLLYPGGCHAGGAVGRAPPEDVATSRSGADRAPPADAADSSNPADRADAAASRNEAGSPARPADAGAQHSSSHLSIPQRTVSSEPGAEPKELPGTTASLLHQLGQIEAGARAVCAVHDQVVARAKLLSRGAPFALPQASKDAAQGPGSSAELEQDGKPSLQARVLELL